MGFFSRVALLGLAVVLGAMPRPVSAVIPIPYDGLVVHVTSDGSGGYVRDDGPSYHVEANVTWHAEYDLTLPHLSDGWGSDFNSVPFGPGTTVSGTSTVNAPILGISCTDESIVLKPPFGEPHKTPFMGIYGGPYDFTSLPTVTLYVDAFGGYDYTLCMSVGGIGVGPFTPAASGGLSWTFEELIGKFAFDMNEWTNQPPHQKTFPVGVSRTAANGTDIASVSWAGTVTLVSSHVQTSGPDPTAQRVKNDALERLRADLPQAIWPCATTVGGVLVFFGSGVTGPIYGSTMLKVAGPLCAKYVKEMEQLRKVYDDPPSSEFRHIAHLRRSAGSSLDLPSCSELTGADRRLCKRTQAAAVRFVSKVTRVADVADVLSTTMDRYTGAVQAGNKTAAKKQLRAAAKRSAQVKKAASARAKAGAKLAALLRSAQVTGTLTAAQFASGTDVVLAQLAEAGIPDAEARTLLGPVLTPQDFDLLVLIAEP